MFHLAAAAHSLNAIDDRDQQDSITVNGTKNVLAAAHDAGVWRLVFASSLSVYGAAGEKVRSEFDLCHPSTAYGRAKLAAEELIANSHLGLQWCILRPAMIYGVGAPGGLTAMVRLVRARLLPPLPREVGRRSFVHVEDVANSALLAASSERAPNETYIVTDGHSMSLREVQDRIRACLGRDLHHWALPPEAIRLVAGLSRGLGTLGAETGRALSAWIERMLAPAEFDSSKIERQLGFVATTSLRCELPTIVSAHWNE